MIICVEGARIIDEEATYIVGAFIEFRINKICDINQAVMCKILFKSILKIKDKILLKSILKILR